MFNVQIMIVAVVSLLFTGCYSEKILRTKPTTFIDKRDVSTDMVLKYVCLDYEEEPESVEDANIFKCSKYTTMSVQNIKNVYKESTDRRKMINELMYISDQNCKTFVERFKYNFIKQDVTSKFLGLNLFGVGFNIGGITDLSNGEFVRLSDTLNVNLNERNDLKENFKTDEIKSKPIEELLLDFMEYDRKCSLITTF